jgi:raffinose/stachyose/melibiose transport system permease protein
MSGTLVLGRMRTPGLLATSGMLAIATLVILYPFWILLIDSLKSGAEFATNPLGLPQDIAAGNYPYAWKTARIGRLTLNSAIVAAVTVLLTLALASTAAFAFSTMRFRGRTTLYLAIISMVTIPVQIYIIPLYVIVVRLGINNTYLGLMLPYTAGSLPLATLLLRNWFDGMPRELLEAARIDGCTRFGTFARIMLPLSRPALSAVTIFTFVHAWNEFFLALVFIQNPELQNLPLGLQVFFVNEYQVEYPRLFATLVLSIAPIAVVYVMLQRQFISGLTSGAVKG